jgi:hypothetical protein
MNPNFPFGSKFRLKAFREQVFDAQAKGQQSDASEYLYNRSHGIKYVVEVENSTAAAVRDFVRGIWEIDVSVENLFPQDRYNLSVPEKLQPFYLVSIPSVSFSDLSENPYDAAYELLSRSRFRSVEPDLPNTQFLGAPTTASSTGSASAPTDKAWSLRNIKADSLWGVVVSPPGKNNGEGVSIAHLDTGWTNHVDLDHVNFDTANRIADFIGPTNSAIDPLNYTGNPGHGTKTGSVIISRDFLSRTAPHGIGQITGVAGLAIYVPIRCIKSVINIYNSNVARAVYHATAVGCDVVSMSLGGAPMKALHAAIQNSVSSDMLVVCAAGNRVGHVVWPARYPESVAVAASNFFDQPWVGTSSGSKVDISAPGEDVWKAEPFPIAANACSPGSGTSYATATLAGVAALWIAFFSKPILDATAKSRSQFLQETFREEIKRTARTPIAWNQSKFGQGIVDVKKLLGSFPTSHTVRPTYNPLSDPNDYIDAGIAGALRLLATNLKSKKLYPITSFENELARIFLDEANERQSENLRMTPVHLLDVLRGRGSQTIRSSAGL